MKKITLNLFVMLIACCFWQVSGQTFNGAGTPSPTFGSGTTGNCTGSVGPAITSDADASSLTGVIGTNPGDYQVDNVNLDISHTWSGDLVLTLTAPDGATQLELSSNNSGNTDDAYTNTTFADGGGAIVGAATPYSGTYQPEGGTFAAAFDGVDVSGDWTLTVEDNVGGDCGTLNSYAITFSIVPPVTAECVGASTALAGDPGTVTPVTLPFMGIGTIGAGMTDMYTLEEVQVSGLDYNMVNELTVTLTSPAGTTVTLFANDGGNSADGTPRDLVFTDNSANNVDDWDNAVTFQPDFMAEGGLLNTAFDGEETSGDWILTITNGGANGGGTLADFCLLIPFNGMVGADPIIECPADITADNDEDACGAIVNFADAIAVDPEDGVIATTQVDDGAPASGEEFPVGVTTVTFEATDSNGNTVTCSFDVTVNDVTEPTIECPAAILMANDAGVCGAMVTVPTPVVTDNCEAAQPGTFTNDFPGQTSGEDASGFYDVGTTTVTFTYTDAGGNMTTCTVDVTVEDTEAPVIVCEGSVEDTISETAAPAAQIINTSPPAVSTITVTETQVITDVNIDLNVNHTWVGDLEIELTSPTGTSVIIYDGAADGCSSNDIVLTFDDESANALSSGCQGGTDDQAYTEADYMPSNALSAFDGEDTAGDWTLSITDSAFGDEGVFNSWGLNLMYEATPLPPLVVELDADGLGSIAPADLLVSATDNCGAVTVTAGGVGDDPITLTTDFASNNGFNANWFDMNITNDVTINSFDVNLGAGVTDDVQVWFKTGTYVGFESDMTAWTLLGEATGITSNGDDVPTPLNLTLGQELTAGDVVAFHITTVNGGTLNYIGSGTGAPGALWASDDNLEILEGSGGSGPFGTSVFTPRNFSGSVIYTEGTGGAATVDFTCEDVGLNEVEVVVTDTAGNEAMCTAIVDVQDNTDPVIVCQDFTLELEDDGTAVLDPLSLLDMDNSVEACGFDIATADVTNFDCSNIGTPTLVTLFVQDPSGNIASCSAMVTVVDVNGPVLTCPDDQVRETEEGTGTYTMEDFTGMATATDGCTDPVTVIAQDPAVGTALGVGSYTVTITATDDLGNMSTCTFTLDVDFLGVDENELSNAIAMYPNPATAIVNLSNTSNIALDRAAIYDVNGKMVSDVNLDGLIGERAIDVSALASGVYIVQISGEGTTIAKRLIIE